MRKVISPYAQEIIDRFQHIKIRDKEVVAPYFRNVKRVRAELRSLVGKGSPEEIAEETIIFAQLRGFPIKSSTADEIRHFMQTQGIGIDCSGYVVHIFDHWLKRSNKPGIARNIRHNGASIYRRFVRKLRPIENISAELLTGELNTKKVRWQNAQPGYIIRLKGIDQGHHVALITAVEYDDNNNITKIEYTHSSPHFHQANGVRIGIIEIKDHTKPLESQNWLEVDEDGEKPTLKEYLNQIEDNGVVKPNFYEKLKWD